jgi:hypothetical protein
MTRARWALLLALVVISAIGILNWPTVYRFKLQASFMFDGQPYIAFGYIECNYQRAWWTSGPHPYQLGDPIYQGYYTRTFRDSPSLVLPDSKGAIVFRDGRGCPPLPIVRTSYNVNPVVATGATWPAYFFPDRDKPKVVWILSDRRADPQLGRFGLTDYLYVPVQEPVPSTLAQNVPAAWRWYEEYSEKYRRAMSGGSGFTQSRELNWNGLFGCVLHDDEWKSRPDFVQAAAGLTTTAVVTIVQPGLDFARNCPSSRTPHISLIPSDDYGRTTLDLDRDDLRWATITTPYISEYRDRSTGQWTPEICVEREGCTGIRMNRAFWIYVPSHRAFVRLDQETLETSLFHNFALRPGDGL